VWKGKENVAKTRHEKGYCEKERKKQIKYFKTCHKNKIDFVLMYK